MTNKKNEARLFIQIDPTHQYANIARWVELSLNNELVMRVQEMHSLLGEHRLQSVTAEFKAKWCLVDGWEVCSQFGGQYTWLDVWPDGLTVMSHVVRAGESNLPRAQSYSVDANYIWGDINGFVSDFYLDSADEPYDRFDTAQGLFDTSPGDPDWEIKFSQDVTAHLSRIGERPLYLHDVVRDRLQG